ncbi:MAG: cysteine hydrolase [Candidatus Woesebacteria bacterium]|jgi:ureidoacrylate peracid hydrolase
MQLQNILNPKHTAVLVIDLQKDFIDDDGKLAKSGQNIASMQAILRPIRKLVSVARQKNTPIIFTQMIDGLKYRNEVGRYRFSKKEKQEKNVCVLEGTEGTKMVGVLPAKKDKIVVKHNYCSFHNTELDSYLKKKRIKSLIVVGVKTNACVETTIRNAYHKGYFVVVPQECVASNSQESHRISLKNIQRYFGDVLALDKILKIWTN